MGKKKKARSSGGPPAGKSAGEPDISRPDSGLASIDASGPDTVKLDGGAAEAEVGIKTARLVEDTAENASGEAAVQAEGKAGNTGGEAEVQTGDTAENAGGEPAVMAGSVAEEQDGLSAEGVRSKTRELETVHEEKSSGKTPELTESQADMRAEDADAQRDNAPAAKQAGAEGATPDKSPPQNMRVVADSAGMHPGEREWRTVTLYLKAAFIILVEVFVIVFLFPPLQAVINSKQSPLKQRSTSPEQMKATKIFTNKIVDKCHTFAGKPWPAEEQSKTQKGLPYFMNVVAPALKEDPGQMMCCILYDRVHSGDDMLAKYGQKFIGLENKMTINPIKDGVSYFFYDLGATSESIRFNLYVATLEVGNIDIIVAPADIDYCVLSGYNPQNFAGGLPAMMQYRPSLPVFVPPAPAGGSEKEFFDSYGCKVERLVVVPPGYHQMSSRVGFLVLPSATMDSYELDLVVRIEKGLAIVASEGRPGMERLITEAEAATGEKVRLYTGGTGMLMGIESDEEAAMLERLRTSHPDLKILANYTTSKLADYFLCDLFGQRYAFLYMGSTVALPNPSLLYRMLER
jgi:metal-dependent hydrolase (beta-lactamase superfamily II)